MLRGCPNWTGALTTLQTSDGAPAAIALLGATGAVERATSLFLELYGDDDAYLTPYQSEVEEIVSGHLDQATVVIDGVAADMSAVVARDGRRYALLAIPRPVTERAEDRANPLLEEPIDESPAIVWLKELDGRYMRVNRRYAEQLQTDPEHVCGKTDAELSPRESIEGWRLRAKDLVPQEPLELEYTVAAFEDRPAFAVLRFALRDDAGQPIAVCGVAAALSQARVARSECERLMRIERWSRLDEAAIREELLDEWSLTPASAISDSPEGRNGRNAPSAAGTGEELAAMLADRNAAIAEAGRLDQQLTEERQQVVALQEQSAQATQRVDELLAHVTAEHGRSAELEQSLARMETRLAELESALESERSRGEQTQSKAAEAIAAERQMVEALRDELATTQEELQRANSTVGELPTPEALEAERERVREAALATEQARAEAAGAIDELEVERRTVQALREELQAAQEEIERALQAAEERARSEEVKAEAQSALAGIREELERAQADAAASSSALSAEWETKEALQAELIAVCEELERVRQEVADRSPAEDLKQQRSRAERAEAAVEEARREAAMNAVALHEERQTVESLRHELQRASADAAASSAALAAEREALEGLHAELTEARELLDQERARVEDLHAELREQREHTEQAIGSAEQARGEATAAAEQIDSLRQDVETLRAALGASREELERMRLEAAASDSQQGAVLIDAPGWGPASQRALSAALSGVSDWRVALKQAVKTLGSEGKWDLAVAWLPDDGGRGRLKCAGMWAADAPAMEAFETLTWQHRPDVSGTEFGRARNRPGASCLLELQSAEDGLLRAAAGEGMGSALLLPIREGEKLIGLMSRTEVPPDAELMLSLEGIALQLSAIAQLVNFAAAPHWGLGRL